MEHELIIIRGNQQNLGINQTCTIPIEDGLYDIDNCTISIKDAFTTSANCFAYQHQHVRLGLSQCEFFVDNKKILNTPNLTALQTQNFQANILRKNDRRFVVEPVEEEKAVAQNGRIYGYQEAYLRTISVSAGIAQSKKSTYKLKTFFPYIFDDVKYLYIKNGYVQLKIGSVSGILMETSNTGFSTVLNVTNICFQLNMTKIHGNVQSDNLKINVEHITAQNQVDLDLNYRVQADEILKNIGFLFTQPTTAAQVQIFRSFPVLTIANEAATYGSPSKQFFSHLADGAGEKIKLKLNKNGYEILDSLSTQDLLFQCMALQENWNMTIPSFHLDCSYNDESVKLWSNSTVSIDYHIILVKFK